jgi:hypothetical protein
MKKTTTKTTGKRYGATNATTNAFNKNGNGMNITTNCRIELAQIIKMDAIIKGISISELLERILENRYANSITNAKSILPKL